MWLFNNPPDTALSVGLNLAQIGEFSFVLLSLAGHYKLIGSKVNLLLMGEWQGKAQLLANMRMVCTLGLTCAAPTQPLPAVPAPAPGGAHRAAPSPPQLCPGLQV